MAPTLSRPVMAGEAIMRCGKPLVHIVFSEYIDKFCSNCLKRSDELKRCPDCHIISYCDKRCQTYDLHHKNECKVFRHKHFDINGCEWKERLLHRIYSCLRAHKTFATERHKLFDGSNVSLNDLKAEVKEVAKNEVFINELTVVCNHFTVYGLEFEYKELLQWFAFISNSLNIITRLIPYFPSESPNKYPFAAIGLYLQFSSLSHSCDPNCVIVCNNDLSLEVQAIKSIPIGEPLTVSAVDLMQKRSEIRDQLKQLSIECQCIECQKNIAEDVVNQSLSMRSEGFLNYKRDETLINKYLDIVSKFIAIAEDIFGDHSWEKTELLFWRLYVLLDCGTPFDYRPFLDQFLDNHRVTHGLKSALKDRIFRKLS